jgi:hypothetical protein
MPGIWSGRYRAEQILEVGCPRCGRPAGQFCNRDFDKLSRHGRELRAAGTPPSHQERMWLRQGHDPSEFDALRAGIKPGDYPHKRAGHGPVRVIDAGSLVACGPDQPPRVRRYTGELPCRECRFTVTVEVAVVDPWTVCCRCRAGHTWVWSAPKPAMRTPARQQGRAGNHERNSI